MKKTLLLFSLLLLNFSCKVDSKKEATNQHQDHTATEKVSANTKKVLSPHESAMAMIGDAHIHIDYSSPGVRGRIIYGGLLAYGEVWQSGAHNATWIETNKDLLLNGNLIKAGKYGFFTIPNKDVWTIIINKNWDQHGKDEYDQKDDVLRFDVTPTLSEDITEHLSYQVQRKNDNEGTISLSWEKVTVSFPISVVEHND